MKRTIALIPALLLSLHSFAAGERLQLNQPVGTGLHLAKLERSHDLSARFKGRTEVEGTFMGYWPEGATNRNYKEPEYILIPSASSKVKLPHFVIREKGFNHAYVVRSIDVQNGQAALEQAAGPDQVRRLNERRVNHVRVIGSFTLEDYVVGVECDSPWARAAIVEAKQATEVAGLSLWPQGGC